MSRTNAPGRGETILLIAVGGFAGAAARYGVELAISSSLLSTLAVNVVGSFALGAIVYENRLVGSFSKRARFVFGTGFLSSFTTYSTFVVDALTAAPPLGLAYLFASYATGFGAVLAARASVRAIANPRGEVVA
ncbi:CrcB family protein [Natronoarchaeum mannanilyticum]|uniref:Fluoride-specific ion channel FluC n=1 Tax=Natronoarchaeum mannanilyticum TaxID=926360 RepID=A0AAV3TCD2_9EURY